MSIDIATLLAEHKRRAEQIAAVYDAAPPKERKAALLVEYRCRQRCLLLTCWQSPMGRLVRLPGYKLSHAKNADAVEPARARNTADGDRRWKPRYLVLDELTPFSDSLRLDARCDHAEHFLRPDEVAGDADSATPGNPTRRTL